MGTLRDRIQKVATHEEMLAEADRLENSADNLYASLLAPSMTERTMRNKARQLREHVTLDRALAASRCYCPGDCNCRHQGSPYNRPNFCGCKQHPTL